MTTSGNDSLPLSAGAGVGCGPGSEGPPSPAGLLHLSGRDGANGTGPDPPLLAHVDKLVSGSFIFFAVLPFVQFNLSCFPLGSVAALLFGAIFMVFAHVIPQHEVYDVIGHQANLTFLLLTVGLMLMAHVFERERLVTMLLRRVLKSHLPFESYLWRVCAISFTLSALLTSDACALLLTPNLLAIWEVQERQNVELETLVLAVATSANIGSAATLFGSPHMALLAARTSGARFTQSTLDLRCCLLYLLPAAVLAFLCNLGFLVCHYRIRSKHIRESKLISEASISEQEMSGLTRTHGSGDLTQLNGALKPSNGLLRYDAAHEQVTYGDEEPESAAPPPCQLETIPEDEVLEITSSRSTSVLDPEVTPEHEGGCGLEEGEEGEVWRRGASEGGVGTMGVRDKQRQEENDAEMYDVGEGSSDEDDDSEHRNSVHAQSGCDTRHEESNSLTMDIEYRPNALALQSQDLSCRSGGALGGGSPRAATPTQSLESCGLRLCDRVGIFRSTVAVSGVGFLRCGGGGGADAEAPGESGSRLFQTFVSFMLCAVMVLNLASTPRAVVFDIGLVPLGASVLVITADAILNRHSAAVTLQRCDWTVLLMFMAVFVWTHAFCNTGLPVWTWHKLGLSDATDSLSVLQLATLVVTCVVGTNALGSFLFTLTILQLLAPCQRQLQLVLCVAWCCGVGGNLTLFGSVSNVVVAQKARQTLDLRLTQWVHVRFAFLTTLVHLVSGLCVVYGILQLVSSVS